MVNNPDQSCRAFFWQDHEPWACGADTRRTEYHYCYDCWSQIRGVGDVFAWPPRTEAGQETRWCLGATRVFQLTRGQMDKWLHRRADGGGWLAQKQPMAASWIAGDRLHDGPWFVYLLRLTDGAMYVGQTKDLEKRLAEHNSGRGARVTTVNQPVSLVHRAAVSTRQAAVDAERLLRDALRSAGMRVSMGEDPDGMWAVVPA